MALLREKPKPPRVPHTVIPVHGEFGRYSVNSTSAAKRGQDEVYIVDVIASEETNTHGTVTGVCPCKRWQIFKKCSHLDDARIEHERIVAHTAANRLGFEKLD